MASRSGFDQTVRRRTFLVFSDYMRGAVRIAALMQAPVTTSGPTTRSGSGGRSTHQPVEHLTALRAIPVWMLCDQPTPTRHRCAG